MRVQLHQLISPGHRGGLDMRKEQMSRHLIHRERPKRSQRRERPVARTTRLDCTRLRRSCSLVEVSSLDGAWSSRAPARRTMHE